jgi:hypothetical protein
MAQNKKEAPQATADAAGRPNIVWDDSNMSSSYANVCNVASTREEVVVLFGTNQAWKGVEAEVRVQLSDRIIMSPFAAKRLAQLLDNVVRQYEGRFGSLDTQQPVPTATSTAPTN